MENSKKSVEAVKSTIPMKIQTKINSPTLFSFKECLSILSKIKDKPLKIPILQIVFVNPFKLTIQNWFYTDSSLILHEKIAATSRGINEKEVIENFAQNSQVLPIKNASPIKNHSFKLYFSKKLLK